MAGFFFAQDIKHGWDPKIAFFVSLNPKIFACGARFPFKIAFFVFWGRSQPCLKPLLVLSQKKTAMYSLSYLSNLEMTTGNVRFTDSWSDPPIVVYTPTKITIEPLPPTIYASKPVTIGGMLTELVGDSPSAAQACQCNRTVLG